MTPMFLQSHKNGVLLRVRVTPKASQSKITGVAGDELKISLHAPPSDGQANAELIKLLSKHLNIPKTAIEIVSGETSRSKRVLLSGATVESMERVLNSQTE